jgi:hypothetical protein
VLLSFFILRIKEDTITKDIVIVEWVDAHSEDGWHDVGKAIKATPPVMHTVGYLLRQDEEVVTITATLDSESDCCSGRWTIPTCCVKSVTKVDNK